MKATDTKTTAVQPVKKNGPFFRKEAGQGFFKPAEPAVQTRLTIGEPGDVFEKEAERVADAVVQRKPIFESENNVETGIQRKEENDEAPTVTEEVESGIVRSKGSGSPLSADTRRQMETAFGTDLSAVRIHDDGLAQEMNKELHAQAFTHGRDIYFDTGKYRPQSVAGLHLLAHELTHVVQQGAAGGLVQRAPAGARRSGLTPGQASIDDVTQKAPFAGGTITRSGSFTTILINNLPIKSNVDKKYLEKIIPKLPLTMPAPGDREKQPTRQIKMWRDMVRPEVLSSLQDTIRRIYRTQNVDDKLKADHLYSLGLPKSTGFTKLVGNYRQLAEECTIPKWSIRGKGMSFQVEHILDFQIAGAKADDRLNLMLLNAEKNRELGGDILRLVRGKIQAILDHYNQFLPKGSLTEKAIDAQQLAKGRYTIKAASFRKVKNNFAEDEAILEPYFSDASKDPLRPGNIDIKAFSDVKDGFFLLQSGKGKAKVLLPFNAENLQVGSYLLTIRGSEAKGLKSITAVLDLGAGVIKDKPPRVDYAVKKVPGENKVFKADKFGHEMSQLEINYLSLVQFGEPELDGGLNLHVEAEIKSPTPRFLKGSIDVAINGRDLSLEKSFLAEELGTVGPIHVDDTDLTLSLSLAEGFHAAGGVRFSIPKAGSGHIEASTNGKGFLFRGGFVFDPNTFDQGTIAVGYDSTRDVPGKNPWTFDGMIVIGKKVRGIDSARIRVGYANGQLNFNGNANLSLPGVRTATISGSYRSGQDFQLALGGVFDFKNKYLHDPKIEIRLSTGGAAGEGGAGGEGNTGWRLGLTGSMVLKVPHLNDVAIAVHYDNGEFDASAEVTDIQVGDDVKGRLTVGVTNKPVDAATGKVSGGGSGTELRLYGSGTITVAFNEHLHSSVGIRLTSDGKVLVNGDLVIDRQPLMPGDKLYGDQFKIFDLHSPEIPVFSIGVGDVFIHFGGRGDALYRIGVPLISADVNLKDVDVHDPAAMKITTTITPEITAMAGIDLSGSFGFGARVAVLKVEGTVTGTIGLHAESTFHPSLSLSWSPTEGLAFTGGEVKLNTDITAGVTLKGGVAVLLDLYFTSVNVWEKSWELGHFDLGELGNMSLNFPLDLGKGGEPVAPKQLRPESPFSSQGAAEKWLNDKPGGGEKKVQGKSDEEIQKEVRENIRQLPAIGPRNPQYQQVLGRDYYYHLLNDTVPMDLEFYRRTWYEVEQEEYEGFKAKMLRPASDLVPKEQQVNEFERDHVTVPPWQIAVLRAVVARLENTK